MIEHIKPVFKVYMWVMSVVILFLVWQNISKFGISGFIANVNKSQSGNISGLTLMVSISLWWITRNLFVGSSKSVTINASTSTIFLVKNIIAPVAVSYIIFLITGNTALTIISVPIVGLVSANIGIG
jgi:hypothetical protein